MEKITNLKSMKAELDYITNKVADMIVFINSNEFVKLNRSEQDFISQQQLYMNQYRRILKIRVDRLAKRKQNEQ